MYSIVHLLLGELVGVEAGLLALIVADALAIATAPSVLLRRRGRPLSSLAWLLALFVLPYAGVLWWWLLGRESVERKSRLRRKSTDEFCECLDGQRTYHPRFEDFDPLIPRRLFSSNNVLEVSQPAAGAGIELLVDGESAFRGLDESIEGATDFIHAMFYIWKSDSTGTRMCEALAAKARAGVEVRVLVDPVGSPTFARHLAPHLESAGARVGYFLPPRWFTFHPTLNFRNHRKLLVVDGRVAVTGGMNIGEEYEREWHDALVRVGGPVVADLHLAFLDDWFFATGENLGVSRYLARPPISGDESASGVVFASGPDRAGSSLHDALLHAIHSATTRVWITTPYFIPSEDLLTALRLAAQRGVDVRVLLPARSDVPLARRAARAYYGMLIAAQVKLYEFQPRVLHMKSLVVDDRWVLLGSANVDVRSFRLNFELSVLLASEALNEAVADLFEADLEDAIEVTPDMMKSSSVSALADALAHLASPLL